jgi:uncharacterized protein (DUF2235 family)
VGKRIIVLSDGTGNTPNKVWRTNVWRTFQSLDRTVADQFAIYDDGVGTSSFIPIAVIGGLFGWGLKRNVLRLYQFVCQNYQSTDDEIFAFGFSRGAFTIRVLIDLIADQGLVSGATLAELDRRAKEAYRRHRLTHSRSLVSLESLLYGILSIFQRKQLLDNNAVRHNVTIRFVGLWDTVAAYGLPIEAMTRAVSRFLWPLDLPTRVLPPMVKRACHAVSLDDERKTFHPILFDESNEVRATPDKDGKRYTKGERISQVWFAGSHANVGGGYPDDSLAYVSLCWILDEATSCGLKLKRQPFADPDAVVNARSERDKDGRFYDSRRGLRGYYRYAPRKISELCHVRNKWYDVQVDIPKVHRSVFDRVTNSAYPYAPIGIPGKYEIVSDGGRILSPDEAEVEGAERAGARAEAQEVIWDIVWKRGALNLATVLSTLCLLFYPFFYRAPPQAEFTTALRPISDLIRLVGVFLPAGLDFWIGNYARTPVVFCILALAVMSSHRWGKRLKIKIVDDMLKYWQVERIEVDSRSGVVRHLRTSNMYRWLSSALSDLLPTIIAVSAMFYLLFFSISVINRVAFYFEDSAGLVCRETDYRNLVQLAPNEKTTDLIIFKASELCQSTGVFLERGARYFISFGSTSSFKDNDLIADKPFYPSNLSMSKRIAFYTKALLRRELERPWFEVVARIGGVGAEEWFIDYDVSSTHPLETTIRATRDGQLFLFVNDAVVGIPGLYDYFYRDNKGQTTVSIYRVR